MRVPDGGRQGTAAQRFGSAPQLRAGCRPRRPRQRRAQLACPESGDAPRNNVALLPGASGAADSRGLACGTSADGPDGSLRCAFGGRAGGPPCGVPTRERPRLVAMVGALRHVACGRAGLAGRRREREMPRIARCCSQRIGRAARGPRRHGRNFGTASWPRGALVARAAVSAGLRGSARRCRPQERRAAWARNDGRGPRPPATLIRFAWM